MTHKVLITCKQMQESLDELLAENPMPDFSFTKPELTKQGFTSSEMVELIKGHDAAIVGDDVVDEAVLSVPGLEYVCKWGVGMDGIDTQAAQHRGVGISNTPGIFGPDVADLAFSYLVGLARQTFEIDRKVRSGRWPRIIGRSISSMKVVVYGYGDIGESIASRLLLSGSEVTVVEVDDARIAKASGVLTTERNLIDATKGADALMVAVPLNRFTEGSVGGAELEAMAGASFVVNISRGAVIQEKELVQSMRAGHTAGAALDVFEQEPLPLNSPLRELEGVIFGSHNASSIDELILRASRASLEIISKYLSPK